MAEPKTRKTLASVNDFLETVDDADRRNDAHEIVKIMESVANDKARMWGEGIVGCGTYNRSYANGSTQEWMLIAFATRKDRITLYVAPGFDNHDLLMAKLGKYKSGKGCIHIKSLSDIHIPTLELLFKESIAYLRKQYP